MLYEDRVPIEGGMSKMLLLFASWYVVSKLRGDLVIEIFVLASFLALSMAAVLNLW